MSVRCLPMKLIIIAELLCIGLSINIEGGYEPSGRGDHYIDGAIFIYMDGNVNLIKKGDKTKPIQIFKCEYQFDGSRMTLRGRECDDMVNKSDGVLDSNSLSLQVTGVNHEQLIFHQTSGPVEYKKTTS